MRKSYYLKIVDGVRIVRYSLDEDEDNFLVSRGFSRISRDVAIAYCKVARDARRHCPMMPRNIALSSTWILPARANMMIFEDCNNQKLILSGGIMVKAYPDSAYIIDYDREVK